jgi:hypothetical protein
MSRARTRPQHTSGAAVASLLTGVFALAVSWVPILGLLAFLFGTVAVVTGFVALRNVRRASIAGYGLAIGGLVAGTLSLVIALTLLYSFIAGFTGPAFRDDVNQLMEAFETE